MQSQYYFILGGEDNEMSEIKAVLHKQKIPFIQPQVRWGKILIPDASLPNDSFQTQLVYVECQPEKPTGEEKIIDHHNELSDKESSLLQVLKLLKKKPTLRQQLIASIDSDFLFHTIKKYPNHKKQVLKIWETGYQKIFPNLTDYEQFRFQCQRLIDDAVRPYPNLLIIYEAPQSTTLLAALCNLKNLACIIIVGSKESDKLKPCFYQGPRWVIKKLAQQHLSKAYWGRRYFGCRAIPTQFITFINQIYTSKLN